MRRVRLSENQFDKLAGFLFDLSKLIIASVVVTFFIPEAAGGQVNLGTFVFGCLAAVGFLAWAVVITPSKNI